MPTTATTTERSSTPPSLNGAQNDTDRASSATNAAAGNSAVNELMSIEKQIAQRCLQNAKEEMQQKQGAEFDKAYIGSQIGGHMEMLAALQVLEQQGPDQVKQIAQQAQPTVQKHLDQAKQLMQQLEGASGSTTGERAARQPAAQQR
jgi:predicted outer membrane protein